MTDNGKHALAMIRAMTQLNKEISQFLRACDKLLRQYGWRPPGGNTIIRDVSQSLDRPEDWAPFGFYRAYKKHHASQTRLCLNIALDEHDRPDMLNEPMVIAAMIEYRDTDRDDAWDPWALWFYAEPRDKHTGTVYPIGERELLSKDLVDGFGWKEEDQRSVKSCKILAVELFNVTTPEKIESGILDKLGITKSRPSDS